MSVCGGEGGGGNWSEMCWIQDCINVNCLSVKLVIAYGPLGPCGMSRSVIVWAHLGLG